MKIGLLQCNILSGAVSANAAMILEAARKAASAGAELCVTSELALSGVPANDLLLRPGFVEHCRNTLHEMSAVLKKEDLPPLLIGAPVANPAMQGKDLHNCAVLLRPDKVIVIARKVLLPADGTHDDHLYFESGLACGVLQHKGWRFAVAVGEDVWNDRSFWKSHRKFESDPVEEFMGGGADGLINLTAIPYGIGIPGLHQRVLSWSAVRYRLPVVCVNQVGGSDSTIYDGGSMAFSGSGAMIVRAEQFAEEVLVADLVNDRTPIAPAKMPIEEEIWRTLVLGTRDFVRKCGFSSVVLGLSGGLDSAMVAAVAAEALGPENVLGVLLPSPYSSAGSIDDALELAANLGIETKTIPISGLMQSFDAALAPAFAGHAPDVTEENIQARIRGSILMSISNKFGKMLLNTGNKSESAVGYCTLYGDTCGGLAVIGDIYKTRVYAVCRWLNAAKGHAHIPQNILDKAPSAELRPGQTDQDSLPPYDVLDELLYAHLEQGQDANLLEEVGYAPDMVKKVIRLVRGAEFKRQQAPPSLHVSARAFGRGWRMPIACGR